jgi:hypothetical protein
MMLTLQQNQLLMERLFKMDRVSSLFILSKVTYIKNVPKPALWDTKDKGNINFFMTEYESYCNEFGYLGDDVRVRSFDTFLKDSAGITFAASRASQIDEPAWARLKAWAIKSWRKPHQHLLDVLSLGAMRWRFDQNLLRYAQEYKSRYLQYGCKKNPQLGLMGAILATLNKNVCRKVWEREALPPTILELLDLVIRLGDVCEYARPNESQGEKKTFNSHFKLKAKYNFCARQPADVTESFKSHLELNQKRTKRVDVKEAQKNNLCFKCRFSGHMSRDCQKKCKANNEGRASHYHQLNDNAIGKSPQTVDKYVLNLMCNFKDVLTNDLPKDLPWIREVNHKIEWVSGAEPLNKAPYRLNQVEFVKLK